MTNRTYELTEHLTLRPIENMSHARYSVPICLLKDQFIVAAGGATTVGAGVKKFTNACEVLDI